MKNKIFKFIPKIKKIKSPFKFKTLNFRFYSTKEPKLPLYQQFKVNGFNLKDYLFAASVVSFGIYSIYSSSNKHSEKTLQLMEIILNSDDSDLINKTLDDIHFNLMTGTDLGALYIQYGIMDRVFQLLSHKEIEIRKMAVKKIFFCFFFLTILKKWKIVSDLKTLPSCEDYFKQNGDNLLKLFTNEIEKVLKEEIDIDEYYNVYKIIFSFNSISDNMQINEDLVEKISRLELKEVFPSSIYLLLMMELTKNDENAYKLKKEINKCYKISKNLSNEEKKNVLLSIRRIFESVKEKEGSFDSLNDLEDFEEIKSDIELVSVNLKGKSFKMNHYMYAFFSSAGIALVWSFLRATIRLAPRRGYRKAFPLIEQSFLRAVIGAGKTTFLLLFLFYFYF